ncbi:predicted protein [Aspergillus terreus NIH2624]|uniref:AAA+ ATPase domain-containing protein n=1 Tax=Aspergillus terreus (strain NIH 2624 / FGSC A1156) TaxID=341663 RepID=Q0CMT6_ASPTN|nr:uncharacterized protein ATEG_04998 [Aspergillus terreus NIH2624]EAU34067.1 predicted protein [Aspergillus terreus NIH2624]
MTRYNNYNDWDDDNEELDELDELEELDDIMEATGSSDSERKDYAPRGSICDVYNLYQTKPDACGQTSWSKKPQKMDAPVENSESSEYALIVRNVKCYDGRRSLNIYSIVVQSALLKTFLEDLFEGYPGVTVTLERLEFKRPFKPFVHRWESFVQARDKVTDATTKAHVDLLYRVLEEELGEVIARKNDLIQNGVITHDLVWTLFEPDAVVYTHATGHEQALKFTAGTSNNSAGFLVAASSIDYNGQQFGFRGESIDIPMYEGTVPITSLPVYPLQYHPEEAATRQRLIARGARWEQLKGYHYKQYEGPSTTSFLNRTVNFRTQTRIIIDAEAYCTFGPVRGTRVFAPFSDELDDAGRLLATPTVRGYSLANKKWAEFNLDGVREIEWNPRAFDSLVLPQGQQHLKQLVLACATAQSKRRDTFDDVVPGKGRGIILQLSGPPGVGKTLTAESVAETMRVPLYALSAEDLGTEAMDVEANLKNILQMVPKWGAVLLLDEADVFMEPRDSADLGRNALVSIFLRMLEYYEGILFLTTNRADHIDPAFESRIHVSLRYSELDAAARRQIWAQFVGQHSGFTEDQLDDIATERLNGREIKNVIKTAHLLALAQESELKYEHVDAVLSLRAFNPV